MSKHERKYINVGTVGHIDYYEHLKPFTLTQYIYGRKFWFLPGSNFLPQHYTAYASIMKYLSEEKTIHILPLKKD
jgi:hypothetical protein